MEHFKLDIDKFIGSTYNILEYSFLKKNKLLKHYIKYDKEARDGDTGFFVEKCYEEDTPANRDKFSSSKSHLKKLVLKEIFPEQIIQSTLLKETLLLDLLAKSTYPVYFFEKATEAIQSVIDSKVIGIDECRFLANIMKKTYFHPARDKFVEHINHLYQAIKWEKRAALIFELQLAVEIQGRLLSKNEDITEVPAIELTTIEQNIPVLRMYVQLIDIHENILKSEAGKSEILPIDKINQLKDDFMINYKTLSNVDLKLIGTRLIWLLNFSYERLDYSIASLADARKVMLNIHQLNKLFVSNELVLTHNIMSPHSFVTITLISSFAQDFDWTQKFWKEYDKFLPTKEKEEANQLSKGYYHFYAGEYKQSKAALDKLTNITDKFFKLQWKVLMLKIVFEQYLEKEIYDNEKVYNLCEQYRNYIRRRCDILSKEKVQALQSFIRITKQLLNMKDNPNFTSKKKEKLEKEIANTKPLVSRAWLFHKFTDMENIH